MTLQSYTNNSEEVVADGANSSINSASTLSTDVYPLPFSAGQKEIVLTNDERALVGEVNTENFITPNTNICVTESSNIDIGNRTVFNRDVTIYQYIQGNNLPEIQNGAVGQDEVECNKTVRVIPPPLVSPITKPKIGIGLVRRHFKAIMILLTIATVICAVTLITLRFVGTKKPNYVPTTTTEEPTSTGTPPSLINYQFNRTQWGGRELPNEEAIEEPVELVIIKHTKTKKCEDVSSCFSAMQELQSNDVGVNHFRDIQYNFVIGGDANIYEGRGWGVRNEQMNNSIDIAYMGDFNKDVPSDFLAAAGNYLVVYGILQGHLSYSATKVVCHNQTEDIDSPGDNLYWKVTKYFNYSYDIIKNSSGRNDL